MAGGVCSAFAVFELVDFQRDLGLALAHLPKKPDMVSMLGSRRDVDDRSRARSSPVSQRSAATHLSSRTRRRRDPESMEQIARHDGSRLCAALRFALRRLGRDDG
jgi:hypothetical protein